MELLVNYLTLRLDCEIDWRKVLDSGTGDVIEDKWSTRFLLTSRRLLRPSSPSMPGPRPPGSPGT